MATFNLWVKREEHLADITEKSHKTVAHTHNTYKFYLILPTLGR